MNAKKYHLLPAPFRARGLATFVLSGLTGAMLLVGSACAADSITSTVKVTPADKMLSGAEWRAISLAGNRVLLHVDGALNALADKKNDEAAKNIEQGLKLVKILEGVLPTTTVETTISGAGSTYSESNRVAATFVPLYREFDSVDVLSSVAEQKQTKRADKQKTTKATMAPEFTYEGTDYSSVQLDLRMARRALVAAQELIKSADTPAASDALKDLMTNGVVYEFSSLRLPLVRAMDNLRLAESEVQAGHPTQAKAALSAAQDALKNYEAIAGDSRSPAVKELEQQITETSKNLAGQTSETFSAKIAGWWDKLRTWL